MHPGIHSFWRNAQPWARDMSQGRLVTGDDRSIFPDTLNLTGYVMRIYRRFFGPSASMGCMSAALLCNAVERRWLLGLQIQRDSFKQSSVRRQRHDDLV